jgi:enoyl-CoA hydratase/carnithine racemase
LESTRPNIHYSLETIENISVLRLQSPDGLNRLTRACVTALVEVIGRLARENALPLIITGNDHFFSTGADLQEIVQLSGPEALEFSALGQTLMNRIENFPARAIAAVRGYCMGGGLDLALACHGRIAAPHAVFGHRGAALGLVTGWGGTQRLPRVIGKARALQMFLAAEKLSAVEALRMGLVTEIHDDPVRASLKHLTRVRTDSLS